MIGVTPSPDRRARALFAAGLIAAGLLLLSVPYLPFQDIPNHTHLLVLDQSIGDNGNIYVRRPDTVAFCYALYIWLARLLSPALSVDAALRLMCVASALALPLATARLAAVLGGPWALAGILALPLGLGWSLRMGLVPYALGLPAVLLGTAAAVLVCRERGARRMAELGLCSVIAYVAHGFAFGLLGVLAALAWMCAGRRSWRSAASILAAFVPAGILVASDALHGAWLHVPGLELTSPGEEIRFRPIGTALVQIVSRSYGIHGPATVGLYLPHFAALVAGAAWLAARPRRIEPRWLVLLGAAGLTLGTVAFPDRIGTLLLIGSRASVIGLCFAAIAAAAWLSRAGARPLRVAVPLTALAFLSSAASIAGDARLVREVVGDTPPRVVVGNVLPVHAADCASVTDYSWGGWDPLRHLWAYALTPEGITPYLFARYRYITVWYRVESLRPHPTSGRLLSNERPLDPAACVQRNRGRVEAALSSPGYDSVIVVGRPSDGTRALDSGGAVAWDRIAPGIWRLARATPPPRL